MSKDKELYQDPVREKLIGFIEKAYEQKNNISTGIIGLFFVLGIVFFMKNSTEAKGSEANSVFGIAQNSYINGLQDFALIELKDIAEDYPSENAGYMAELYIAAELFSNGTFDEADSHLNLISGKFEVDVLNANIYGMRADIALSKGDLDEAIIFYNKAMKTCGLSNYKIKFNIGKLYALQAKGEHRKVVEIANGLLDEENISSVARNNVQELKAYSQHFTM